MRNSYHNDIVQERQDNVPLLFSCLPLRRLHTGQLSAIFINVGNKTPISVLSPRNFVGKQCFHSRHSNFFARAPKFPFLIIIKFPYKFPGSYFIADTIIKPLQTIYTSSANE